MSHKLNGAVAVIGIDIGKNSFHLVGLDKRGAIVLGGRNGRAAKWKRGSPICRPAGSGWKPASVPIISVASFRRLATMLGLCRRNTSARTARDRRTTSAMPRRSLKRYSARP